MKAMLEPTIVAARTHRLAEGVSASAEPPCRMKASSQGGFPIWLISFDAGDSWLVQEGRKQLPVL
ncbi:MAG TPA: hypothetical protein VF934_12790 [Burkholderiales bacterium]